MFKQHLKIKVLSSQGNSSKHNSKLDHHSIQQYDRTAQNSKLNRTERNVNPQLKVICYPILF